MRLLLRPLLLVLLAPLAAEAEDSLTVAVASNFRTVAEEIATAFTERTGVPVRLSSGSTGKLYAQIVNGAPYDVLLAADTERPQRLVDTELAVPDTYFVYATGQLVLWSSDPAYASQNCRAAFMNGRFNKLAIANPATAPYGLAARRFLEVAGLWDTFEDKLVYGENVSQAFQFVASGNASMGLIAASQVIGETPYKTSCHWAVEIGDVRPPVHQAGVVLARSMNKASAMAFADFLRMPAAQQIIVRHGYVPRPLTLTGDEE